MQRVGCSWIEKERANEKGNGGEDSMSNYDQLGDNQTSDTTFSSMTQQVCLESSLVGARVTLSL